jgi:hypothetical protein
MTAPAFVFDGLGHCIDIVRVREPGIALVLDTAASLPPSRPTRERDAKAPAMQHLLGAFSKEGTMWKVSDVEPVRVMGAEGYPCTDSMLPPKTASRLSHLLMHPEPFSEAGATHLESALLNAISVPSLRRINHGGAF